MPTSADLITGALQRIQVYSPGEWAQEADLAYGLNNLNQLMDQWSNQNLACFAILEQSAPLVPGQASYKIGIGAPDFNMIRPLSILTDPGTAYVQDSNGNNYSVEVVPRDRWNLYSNRSSIVTSNFPNVLFYDPQMPYGVINLTPYPNTAYTLFWDSMLQLSDFSSLTTAMNFPVGYEFAISTNLALLLAPAYPTAVVNPLLVKQAMDSLGNIKRTNQRELYALFDQEIVARGNLSYNVWTDSVGSVTPSV